MVRHLQVAVFNLQHPSHL